MIHLLLYFTRSGEQLGEAVCLGMELSVLMRRQDRLKFIGCLLEAVSEWSDSLYTRLIYQEIARTTIVIEPSKQLVESVAQYSQEDCQL